MNNEHDRDPESLDARLTRLVEQPTALSAPELQLFNRHLEDLTRAHGGRVKAMLRHRGLSGHEIKDLEQDIFTAFYIDVRDNGFPADVRAALKNLTRAKLTSYRRKRIRQGETSLPTSSMEVPGSLGAAESTAVKLAAIQRLRASLSEELLDVFDVVSIGQTPHSEAAEVLGIPLGTVKTRVLAVRKLAMEILKPEESKR